MTVGKSLSLSWKRSRLALNHDRDATSGNMRGSPK